MPTDTPPIIASPTSRRRSVTIADMAAIIVVVAFLMLWTKSFWKGNGIGYISYTYTDRGTAQRSIHDAEIISGSTIFGSDQLTISGQDQVEGTKHQQRGFYVYSPQPRYAYVNWTPRRSIWNKLGVFVMTDSGRADTSLRRVIVPGWFILLLSGSITAILLHRAYRRWIRMTRQTRGACLNCGYDLRASPGRCPECGDRILGQTERRDGSGLPKSALG